MTQGDDNNGNPPPVLRGRVSLQDILRETGGKIPVPGAEGENWSSGTGGPRGLSINNGLPEKPTHRFSWKKTILWMGGACLTLGTLLFAYHYAAENLPKLVKAATNYVTGQSQLPHSTGPDAELFDKNNRSPLHVVPTDTGEVRPEPYHIVVSAYTDVNNKTTKEIVVPLTYLFKLAGRKVGCTPESCAPYTLSYDDNRSPVVDSGIQTVGQKLASLGGHQNKAVGTIIEDVRGEIDTPPVTLSNTTVLNSRIHVTQEALDRLTNNPALQAHFNYQVSRVLETFQSYFQEPDHALEAYIDVNSEYGKGGSVGRSMLGADLPFTASFPSNVESVTESVYQQRLKRQQQQAQNGSGSPDTLQL
jgi:hypothetical protein